MRGLVQGVSRLWSTTAVAGYIALANLAHLTLTGTVFLARVHDWLLTTWSLSIVTQFGATLLIGYRFWRSVQWSSEGTRASRLSILWILIESGAIYSLTTVFLLGFSSTNTGALFAAGLGQISVRLPPSPRYSLMVSARYSTNLLYIYIGAGSDTDHCEGRAEKQELIVIFHTCKRID